VGSRPVANTQRLTMNRSVCIHFLDLLDGSPRSVPPSNLTWESPREIDGTHVRTLVITGSRIMMHVYCLEVVGDGDVWVQKIFVWDWKTGNLVRPPWF